jgi:hypothetical protein
MKYEILSIETAGKIARLEKENNEYQEIIDKFDKEINRQFKIIKNAITLIEDNNTTFSTKEWKETLLKTLKEVHNV